VKYAFFLATSLAINSFANAPTPLVMQKKAELRPSHLAANQSSAPSINLFQQGQHNPSVENLERRPPPPSQPAIDGDKVLAEKTKGVILLGKPEDLITGDLSEVSGVEIKDLDIPGDPQQLKELLEADFKDEPLTLNLIAEMKRTILQYYVSQNKPIILIEVPEQDVTHGVVQLVVHSGKLGDVVFRGNKYFSSADLLKYIDLEKGKAIDYDVLMSNMEWLNRSPFHHSILYITPGLFPGTTNIELEVSDRRPLNVYVGADNTGNRFTGFERYYAGFTATRFFNLNHILNYQFTESNRWSRYQAHVLNYTIPLPWHHILLLVGGYEKTVPKIPDFHAKSGSTRAQVQYIIPLTPTFKKLFHEIAIQGDFEDNLYKLDFVANGLRMPIQTTRAIATDIALGYNGRFDSYPHHILYSALLFCSPGKWLPHQSNHTYQELRPFAKNRYVFSDLYLEYSYTFKNDIVLSQKLKGQISSTNLIFNTYTIADYYSVRGYKDYFNRDNAFIYNLDLISMPYIFGKQKQGTFRGLVFFDYGIGSNHTLIPGERRSLYAMSAGPGLRFSVDPYGWLRLDCGFPFHNLPLSPQKHTPWVQFGAFFNF
jgi:hemolysin activation/secretion protein